MSCFVCPGASRKGKSPDSYSSAESLDSVDETDSRAESFSRSESHSSEEGVSISASDASAFNRETSVQSQGVMNFLLNAIEGHANGDDGFGDDGGWGSEDDIDISDGEYDTETTGYDTEVTSQLPPTTQDEPTQPTPPPPPMAAANAAAREVRNQGSKPRSQVWA